MNLLVFLFRVRSKKVNVGITMNFYTHLGFEDAADELKRIEAPACKEENREKAGHTAGAAIVQISLIF